MSKVKQPPKWRVLLALCAVLSPSSAALAEAPTKLGRDLFREHCVACHKPRGPVADRAAPPMFAVKRHYLPFYASKDAFVEAVADWVKAPNKQNALMPGAVRRFGLMPEMDLSEEHLRKIAEYVFEADFAAPGWFREHYREEHGRYPEEFQ